jgi:hypothetical protein
MRSLNAPVNSNDVTTKAYVDASVNLVSTTITLAASLSQYVYLLQASAVVTLPTAVGAFSIYTIKNIDTANKNIATTSAQTIEGSASPIVIVPNQSVTLVSDGSNWRII